MNWFTTLFDADHWEGTATLIAGAVAVAGVLIGFWVDRIVRRNARRGEAYAGALQAVHDYLEAPYRIRRSSGNTEERFALVAAVSDIQSRLEYFDGLLSTVAPAKVHTQFQVLVAAARREAGRAMTDAWKARPTRRNADVPLGGRLFEHPDSDAARKEFLRLTR
ncbi:MAG: hypothetical protein BGO95_06580 [Micrococcales bacterium 73-13]|nr:MAG: hypothetical protein BGO95_06580 [Micrococcales bacterium 73-13]